MVALRKRHARALGDKLGDKPTSLDWITVAKNDGS
jgi:hypothetical protein